MKLTLSEQRVVLIVAAVQFVNSMDFSMVTPMGPQLAIALGISTAHIGYLGGSYIAAAFVAGLIGSLVLDRIDRRRALGVVMIGLVTATALCGFAVGMRSMIAARTIAGLCGGPAAAISLAIVTDGVAIERRGRAMGVVSAAYGMASILGIPAGLQLAIWGGWQLPFFAVAGLGSILVVGAYTMLPPQRRHLTHQGSIGRVVSELFAVASRPTTLISLGVIALMMSGIAMVISNLAPYLVFNMGFPNEYLGYLWMLGGIVGVGASQIAGRLTDRMGTMPIFWTTSLFSALSVGILCFILSPDAPISVLFIIFAIYMAGNMGCFVTWNAMLSKLPEPHERGRFMSLVASAQHAAGAISIFLGTSLLSEQADGGIAHMGRVVALGMLATLGAPALAGMLSRRMKTAGAQQAPESIVILAEAGL